MSFFFLYTFFFKCFAKFESNKSTLSSFSSSHVSNGSSEEEDVGLWSMYHVVDPTL